MEIHSLQDLGRLPLPVLAAGAVPVVLLVGFGVLLAAGRKLGGGGWLGTGLSGLVALLGAFVAMAVMQEDGEFLPYHAQLTWFEAGWLNFDLSVWLDHKSALMLGLVTGISLLVHVFSLAYMAHDAKRHRYWAYLSLFCSAMTFLVIADNLFQMFVGWELVGLASYLLIGFWHRDRLPAMASQKAFIVNRIADAGFVVALMLMAHHKGSFAWYHLEYDPGYVDYLIGACLLVGAMGKSAQFPFQVWLPDAMAGPTPVSSLIHAATMVVAGVFLLIRVESLVAVAVFVGALTALIAAISALTQHDIKRVLAYSTVSQLGFMVMGIGVQESNWAFFHLLTHAFFKCGLFLVAAVVIHQQHEAQEKLHHHFDAQDMRFMGGLRKRMPLAFVCWLLFAAALAGLPLTSGFLSKDGIVLATVNWAAEHGQNGGFWPWLVPASAIATSLLTAFYIARQGMLVWGGHNRASAAGAPADYLGALPRIHWAMALPLVLLALGSTWILFSPTNPIHMHFLAPLEPELPWLPWALAGLAVVGIGSAVWVYRQGPLSRPAYGILHDLSFKHFFLDDIYQGLLVRPFLALTRLLALADHYVVDGLVRVVAGAVKRTRPQLGVPQDRPSLSWAAGWWDRNVIDRAVNGVATLVQRGGKQASRLQSGRVQTYLLLTVVAMLLLVLGMSSIFTA